MQIAVFIIILLLIALILFIWNQGFLKCVKGETCYFFKENNSKNLNLISRYYSESLCWRNSLLTSILIITLLSLTGLITNNYKSIILILIIVFTINYFYCNYWDYHYYKPGFRKIEEISDNNKILKNINELE
jgi:hypothetical protein